MTNQRINNTEIWSKRKLLYQTAADLFIGFFLKKPTCMFTALKGFTIVMCKTGYAFICVGFVQKKKSLKKKSLLF